MKTCVIEIKYFRIFLRLNQMLQNFKILLLKLGKKEV